jgi:hypothetical protein
LSPTEVLVADLLLVELAGWETREFVPEIDDSRNLETSQMFTGVGTQAFDRRIVGGNSGFKLDNGMDVFAKLRVRKSEYCDVHHIGMHDQH